MGKFNVVSDERHGERMRRFHRWLANLRVLAIEEGKSVPYAPVSHPFIERLIGSVRRGYLDHVFFWNAIDPEPEPMHPKPTFVASTT